MDVFDVFFEAEARNTVYIRNLSRVSQKGCHVGPWGFYVAPPKAEVPKSQRMCFEKPLRALDMTSDTSAGRVGTKRYIYILQGLVVGICRIIVLKGFC